MRVVSPENRSSSTSGQQEAARDWAKLSYPSWRRSAQNGLHSTNFANSLGPGVGIRTKFLPLSDRRPSRGLKFLACPTESRAEPNCPIVRKSARLASRLGSRALFRTNSDTGQPSSRGSRNTFLGIFHNFFLFSSNYYYSRAILETVTPSNLDFAKNKKEKIIFIG